MLDKYNKIWNVIKNKRKIKFYSMSVYDKTCITAKVREFDSKIKTNFLGNEVAKENMYFTFIACITIDSVMKMGKKLFSFYSYIYGFYQTCLIIKSCKST